jgi:hypothetical protein
MSDLVAVVFDDESTAFEMRAALVKMQREYLLELEDAVVVSKDIKNKVKLSSIGELDLGRGTESIPDTIPSMADAVRRLAELGGHAGRKTSGPPGAVTIRRDLELITPIALALEALESEADL